MANRHINPKSLARFTSKYTIDPVTGCYEWQAGRSKYGYGKLTFQGKDWRAHRFAWWLAGKELPDWQNGQGDCLDHICRNRACVNVEHLRVISHAENVRIGDRSNLGENMRSKTHCPKGHPYDEGNTYISKGGSRFCRTCHRIRTREYMRQYRQRKLQEGISHRK